MQLGTNRIAEDIKDAFKSLNYPSDFEYLYDQIECLKSDSGKETFLVVSKKDNEYYIAKCYNKKKYSFIPEIFIPIMLNHDGIPKHIGNYENDDYFIVVREFVEGVTLDRYVTENKLSDNDKLSICDKLADILIYLHNQEKPVIHRDIKPENIIVKENGDIFLIDFDIARTYKNEKETDTVFFGTKVYAPPEQYGFEQTDQKSDIYSFGRLMHYMFYGDPKKEEVTIDKRIKTVIDKCTSFSPTDRYSSMKDVKNDLSNNNQNKTIIISTLAIIAIVAFLFLVFIGKNFEPTKEPVTFKEKVVEEAVRLQLGINETDPIYEDDLLNVKKIIMLGNEAFKNTSDTYNHGPDDIIVGRIKTLDDFKMLPNVETVCVGMQNAIDISGLIFCKNLQSLELKHVRFKELSPLRKLENLNALFIFDTAVTDITMLNNLKHLEHLDVGCTDITEINKIGVFPNLKELSIKMLGLYSLDGIELMTKIEVVWLNGSGIGDISALAKLPNLKSVHTDAAYFNAISKLLEGRDIDIICEE